MTLTHGHSAAIQDDRPLGRTPDDPGPYFLLQVVPAPPEPAAFERIASLRLL